MRGFRPETMRYLFREIFLADEYTFPGHRSRSRDRGLRCEHRLLGTYFRRLHPRARIVAFEANPGAFQLLKHNVSNNHLEQVEPLPVALSDHDGEIPFFIDLEPGSLTASTRRDRGGEQQLMVKCERLSKTLASLDRVDRVKIDVEGAEWAILNDLIASGTLAKPERYIIEYHHDIAVSA
jgi:FkbM family methyltransferase